MAGIDARGSRAPRPGVVLWFVSCCLLAVLLTLMPPINDPINELPAPHPPPGHAAPQPGVHEGGGGGHVWPTWWDACLWLFVGGIVEGEIGEVLQKGLYGYTRDPFNVLDVSALLTMTVSAP